MIKEILLLGLSTIYRQVRLLLLNYTVTSSGFSPSSSCIKFWILFSQIKFNIYCFSSIHLIISPDRFGILFLTQGRHYTHLLLTLYQVSSRDSFYLHQMKNLLKFHFVVSISQRTLFNHLEFLFPFDIFNIV